jgi:biopolymer transport protein ExbD/biopolymer transport protein TolR
MAMVVFVLVIVFMTLPQPHHGISADLPKVLHPVSMPGANREDAIKITITRDGSVYIGNEQVAPSELTIAEKLTGCLQDREVEHKAYIVADMRVRWGTVETVLDGVRVAGIIRVAFLADQRKSLTQSHP